MALIGSEAKASSLLQQCVAARCATRSTLGASVRRVSTCRRRRLTRTLELTDAVVRQCTRHRRMRRRQSATVRAWVARTQKRCQARTTWTTTLTPCAFASACTMAAGRLTPKTTRLVRVTSGTAAALSCRRAASRSCRTGSLRTRTWSIRSRRTQRSSSCRATQGWTSSRSSSGSSRTASASVQRTTRSRTAHRDSVQA